jgi:hypothetical protein
MLRQRWQHTTTSALYADGIDDTTPADAHWVPTGYTPAEGKWGQWHVVGISYVTLNDWRVFIAWRRLLTEVEDVGQERGDR